MKLPLILLGLLTFFQTNICQHITESQVMYFDNLSNEPVFNYFLESAFDKSRKKFLFKQGLKDYNFNCNDTICLLETFDITTGEVQSIFWNSKIKYSYVYDSFNDSFSNAEPIYPDIILDKIFKNDTAFLRKNKREYSFEGLINLKTLLW